LSRTGFSLSDVFDIDFVAPLKSWKHPFKNQPKQRSNLNNFCRLLLTFIGGKFYRLL
jgi:hypothetical protein